MDLQVAVWRRVQVGPRGINAVYNDTQIVPRVAAAIVPISDFDIHVPYAHESTHIVWVPYWLLLRKEDEVRYGRDDPDASGNVQPYRYTINGRREFRLGIPQRAYYAKELD